MDSKPVTTILKRHEERAHETRAARLMDDEDDVDYWLSSRNGVAATGPFYVPTAWTRPTAVPVRPSSLQLPQRGRPRVLPEGTGQDPGLRMQQPGWDAQRERLNHLPRGFAPAGAASLQPRQPSSRNMDQEALDIRTQQLSHALRSAFQHARFPNLATTAVTEGGEQQRQRWIQAREAVLRGELEVRDYCAVSW